MKILTSAGELIKKGYWDKYCAANGINEYSVNEGLMDSEMGIVLTIQEAKNYGLISIDMVSELIDM